MINEIKKLLARGEVVELECVNAYGFINNNRGHVREKEEMLSSSLAVHSVDDGRNVVLHSSYFLRESDLEYFLIKRPASTFNDLIDVAVQAYKDGIADEIILNDDISISTQAETYGVSKTDTNSFEVKETIKKIKSLYTETFVIKTRADIKPRIKAGAKYTHQNGLTGTVISVCYQDAGAITVKFDDIDGEIGVMVELSSIFSLKGATITQKKGY